MTNSPSRPWLEKGVPDDYLAVLRVDLEYIDLTAYRRDLDTNDVRWWDDLFYRCSRVDSRFACDANPDGPLLIGTINGNESLTLFGSGDPLSSTNVANMESTVWDWPSKGSPMEPFDLGAELELSDTSRSEGRSGAWLTGSNDESLTACPHRRMWAAEWVGTAG